jgi:hypothetical protein
MDTVAETRYAILMYADPEHSVAMTKEQLDEIARKHAALRAELEASGELAGGAGLALPHETTVLRLSGSDVETKQGPLAHDATEHLTAYYEVDCESLDRAHQIGAHVLDHHVTSVEVRRIHDTAG